MEHMAPITHATLTRVRQWLDDYHMGIITAAELQSAVLVATWLDPRHNG